MAEQEKKPVGRPPKMVRLEVVFIEEVGVISKKYDIPAKEAKDKIADIMTNGCTRVKGKWTYHITPASIKWIMEK